MQRRGVSKEVEKGGLRDAQGEEEGPKHPTEETLKV